MQAHFLEGRKMPRRQTGTRWIDTYKVRCFQVFSQRYWHQQSGSSVCDNAAMPACSCAPSSHSPTLDWLSSEHTLWSSHVNNSCLLMRPISGTCDVTLDPFLQLPGQMIGIKYCPEGQEEPTQTAKRLFAIASSPYDSRRDSSMLDASMIEVYPGHSMLQTVKPLLASNAATGCMYYDLRHADVCEKMGMAPVTHIMQHAQDREECQ